MSVTRGTVESIQFLRFVAATLVVICHCYEGMSGTFGAASAAGAGYLMHFGSVGVHIFFVISGYIMYLTNFGRDRPPTVGQFLARRLIRIFVPYLIFVAIYVLVLRLIGSLPTMTTAETVRMLLLYPGDAPRIVGPAWSLPYELYFYLLFGLVLGLGAKSGTIALSLFFLASAGLGAVVHPVNIAARLPFDSLLIEFVAGLWIARLTTRHTLPVALGWSAIGIAIAIYTLGLALGYARLPSLIAWGVPSALLVGGAVILERAAPFLPRHPVRSLAPLGDSSYTLYLGHSILIFVVATGSNAIGWGVPLPILIPVTVLVCIAVAHLFYARVEHPIVRGLHRFTESPRQRAPIEEQRSHAG